MSVGMEMLVDECVRGKKAPRDTMVRSKDLWWQKSSLINQKGMTRSISQRGRSFRLGKFSPAAGRCGNAQFTKRVHQRG